MKSAPSQSILRSSLALALAAPGTFFVADAHAQQAPGAATQLEPVTVTGTPETYQKTHSAQPKLTAPLLDTPRSVTVIPEELVKDRAATSLVDVLRTTPGITFGAGEGGTPIGDRPFVRGYEASTDIFVDGMRDLGRASHEMFNLESVEIIKGPGSAYSGRGSTGGSINLVSKTPKLKNFAEVGAGYGTDQNYRVTGDGNWMFSDTSAFRLNLMRMGGDVPGRDEVTLDRYGVAPSIAFGLGTPTRATLSYYHMQNDDMPDLGLPFRNAARPDRVTPPDVDRNNFYGRTETDYRKNTADMATAMIEHDFSDRLTVRNATRWSRTVNDYLLTRPSFDNCTATSGPPCSTEGPGAMMQRGTRTNYQVNESWFNQTDIYGELDTGSVKHHFVAGVEFSQEKIDKKAVTVTGAIDTRDSLYDPDPNRSYNYSVRRAGSEPNAKVSTRALYVFDTMQFTEHWEANVGLRYDQYKVETYTKPSNNNPDPYNNRTDNLFNYQLGLVYKPVPYGSIYVSYGTSSNPSGETAGQSGGADGAAGGGIRDLAPEKSRTWELGTKWDVLDSKLSLTGAIFETRKTDARSTDPVTGDVTLSGDSRTRGFELGLAGAITPKWSVWGGYTYLDPKLVSFRNGSNDYSGNQMKFVSKQSFSVWTTYKVLPQFTLGAGATHVGKRFVDDENKLYLPSYWRYDAMAKYQVNKALDLQLNVNNLSNKKYYDASHVGLFAYVGPGRSAMVTATYRYE